MTDLGRRAMEGVGMNLPLGHEFAPYDCQTGGGDGFPCDEHSDMCRLCPDEPLSRAAHLPAEPAPKEPKVSHSDRYGTWDEEPVAQPAPEICPRCGVLETIVLGPPESSMCGCDLIKAPPEATPSAEEFAEVVIAIYGSCLSQSESKEVAQGAHPGDVCAAVITSAIVERDLARAAAIRRESEARINGLEMDLRAERKIIADLQMAIIDAGWRDRKVVR